MPLVTDNGCVCVCVLNLLHELGPCSAKVFFFKQDYK